MAQVKHKDQKALSFRHLIESRQVTRDDVFQILSMAERYRTEANQGVRRWNDADGYILATLFFEPSTRTRFSFETAMLRLGGQIISLEAGLSSSLKKGESLSDMGRVMSGYADMIVMRHPEAGSAAEFSQTALVPVINGGDGANQHPTQSLADLYTIQIEKGRLDNLTIGVMGDLKHSRTVHSLLSLLNLYPGNRFVLISHPSLRLDKNDYGGLSNVTETAELSQVISGLDILYVTRVQEERFADKAAYAKVKDDFILRPEALLAAKKDMTLMHALPRVNEIHRDIDRTTQARYFEQAGRAVFVRMALLSLMKESGPILAAR